MMLKKGQPICIRASPITPLFLVDIKFRLLLCWSKHRNDMILLNQKQGQGCHSSFITYLHTTSVYAMLCSMVYVYKYIYICVQSLWGHVMLLCLYLPSSLITPMLSSLILPSFLALGNVPLSSYYFSNYIK